MPLRPSRTPGVLQMRTRPPLTAIAAVGALIIGAATAATGAPADDGPLPSAAGSPAEDATSLGIPLNDVRADGGTVATTPDGVPTAYTVTSGEPAHLVAAHAGTGEIL